MRVKTRRGTQLRRVPHRQPEVLASGDSLETLTLTGANFDIPVGAFLDVRMQVGPVIASAFDAFGAELIFEPFKPPDTRIVDVFGAGGQGIVRLEVLAPSLSPLAGHAQMRVIPLIAIAGFIAANWVLVAIGGVFLTAAVVASVVILGDRIGDIIEATTGLAWALVAVGVVFVFISLAPKKRT